MTRSWHMFAGNSGVEGRFLHVADERTVRFCGLEPVPVVLTEDPDGEYYGWIWAASDGPLPRTFTGIPVMIQWHRGIFEMQSPDGFADKLARGDGEIVRMSCRALPDAG